MRKTIVAIGFLFMILLLLLSWLPKDKSSAKRDFINQSKASTTPASTNSNKALMTPATTNSNKASTTPAPSNSTKATRTQTNTISSSESTIGQGERNKEGEPVETVNQNKADFYYEVIPDSVKIRIMGKSYGENCDVPLEDLRYVGVLYWGFDLETHRGELIVNRAIATDIVDIFKELYEYKYPIEQMVLVDEYNADDNTSMAADNSSAFNYRNIDGTSRKSLHSYGLAIDINPRYNPYVRGSGEKLIITPDNGIEYADRLLDCPYYIKKDDLCYQAFINRGFTWGGEWTTQKDYQHFQKTLD